MMIHYALSKLEHTLFHAYKIQCQNQTKIPKYAHMYVYQGHTRFIDSSYTRAELRGIVIGQEALGFPKTEVGLYSIRSGVATTIFYKDFLLYQYKEWKDGKEMPSWNHSPYMHRKR